MLVIGLGANLSSPVGPPLATLEAVRLLLEPSLRELGHPSLWSPLFRTTPVGGPSGQPDYLNAVVQVSTASPPDPAAALRLLSQLQELERRFARQRGERWGPRSLDLDLLWWGDLRCRGDVLELPHPRLLERAFVLTPLAAIDPGLVPPGARATAAELLNRLLAGASDPAPQRLPGRPGWPE